MRRVAAVGVCLVLGLLLLVPYAGAASFVQAGNGPQRTGQIPYEGPATNDTAFEVELPGVPIDQPALIDDDLYVVTYANEYRGYDGDTQNLTESALWRIGVDDASVERVMDVPTDEGFFSIDAPIGSDRLILEDASDEELVAVEVPSGEELWRTKALPEDPRTERYYVDAVQVDQTLYVGFLAVCAGAEGCTATAFTTERVGGVMAVDLATGEELWTWTRTETEPADPSPDPEKARATGDPVVTSIYLSADGERVYAYMLLWHNPDDSAGTGDEYVYARADRRTYELRALEAGASLWNHTDTEQAGAGVFTSDSRFSYYDMTGFQCCAYPLVTETQVTMRLDAFEAYNPATGEEIWTSEAGRSDHIDRQGAYTMGIRGEALMGTSPQTVYRLDAAEQGDIVWQDTSTDQSYGNEPTVIDEDTAYVPFHPDEDEDNFSDIGIEARDVETGEVRWQWSHHPSAGIDDPTFQQDSANPAYGPGILAWPAKDGTVTVVGETEASLGAPDVETDMYPKPGEAVTIDASDTQPGTFGEATRYMVDWGDGSVSSWQTDPVFTHTYEDEQTHHARVYAGNDANQTSSTPVTMNVGQEEPTWLSERFEEGNQDMTFGVIGVALALGGGLVTAGQRYRKRSNLESELQALEEGFEETRHQPSECEAFLDTRKARARSLALDGYLNEDQIGIIETRAEELRGKLRTEALEEEFGFLPYSLVTKARQMVQDGEVTALEREAFLAAIEDDDVLTSGQKATVRERVEAWYGRDAGGDTA